MRTLFSVAVLALSLALFGYVENQAQAQALQLAKPFTGKINKAVASTITKRLQTLGFAANDPIYASTLAAAETVVSGAVAVGSVATTVAAVGSAPVWLSVALGLGAAYEIYDFSMGTNDWAAKSGGVALNIKPPNLSFAVNDTVPIISVTGGASYVPSAAELGVDYLNPGPGYPVQYPANLRMCSDAGRCANTVDEIESTTKAAAHLVKANYNQSWYPGIPGGYVQTVTDFNLISRTGPTKQACTVNVLTCPQGYQYRSSFTYNVKATRVNYDQAEPELPLTTYETYVDTTITKSVLIFSNPSFIDVTRTYSPNDAAASLSSADLNQLADPDLLAALANRIWQQAAQQPGYQGAPFDVQNPVTASDILADIAAGLYPHPTVYDLLSLPSPNAQTAPALDPAAQPVPESSSDPKLDLGPDPGIATPGLEDSPTGSSIVEHVMGLLPSISGFSVPSHVSACELPTFDFFGHTMYMDSGCGVIETQRGLISTLFTAIWGISALMFVLRA